MLDPAELGSSVYSPRPQVSLIRAKEGRVDTVPSIPSPIEGGGTPLGIILMVHLKSLQNNRWNSVQILAERQQMQHIVTVLIESQANVSWHHALSTNATGVSGQKTS